MNINKEKYQKTFNMLCSDVQPEVEIISLQYQNTTYISMCNEKRLHFKTIVIISKRD